MSDAVEHILNLKHKHRNTWRDKSDWYWFRGLCEEVIELGLSLLRLHRGPTNWELAQISAIAMNWMEMRTQRPEQAGRGRE